jgi:hypothetical protein
VADDTPLVQRHKVDRRPQIMPIDVKPIRLADDLPAAIFDKHAMAQRKRAGQQVMSRKAVGGLDDLDPHPLPLSRAAGLHWELLMVSVGSLRRS